MGVLNDGGFGSFACKYWSLLTDIWPNGIIIDTSKATFSPPTREMDDGLLRVPDGCIEIS